MSNIEQKLSELGLTLPTPAKPAAHYAPWVVVDRWVFISGQLPLVDGQPHFIGRVGHEFNTMVAQEAARLCALNIISVLKEATQGNLDRIERCLRLGGFVNAAPDFKEHSQVINGASDLMAAVLGEGGKHARAAIGCSSLPFGVCVEVEGLFLLKSAQ
jgi:enamine deaminase RidA (YjgF/YER057c/UK114 family)